MNRQIFREYDIRGVVENDFTPDVVENIGKTFGSRVIRGGGKRVAVGMDMRTSSKPLFDILAKGLCATGCDVVNVGEVPTPLLYFAEYHLNTDAAIMITGSHNPPEFNGFKLLIGKSSVHGDEIRKMADEIDTADFCTGDGTVETADVIEPYLAMVKEKISLGKNLKVVVDAGNGCGGIVAPRLLRELGCEVVELYCEPDGTFPNHHPDPTVEKNMKDLMKAVVEHKADVGIGYDGDADRIGVVDDKGTLLYGDQELMIFAKDMLGRNPGAKIIFDVKCSRNLPEFVKKYGGMPIMSATGHSIIKARLNSEKALLAGEMSAHIFFKEDYFGYDDAIYATARLLKIMDGEAKPVSRFLEEVPQTFSTPEIRVDCPDEVKFDIVRDMVDYYRGKYEVIDIDGVRIDFGEGWGLIRASNTQPVLVLRFEAGSTEQLEEYKREVHTKLASFGPMAGLEPF